MKEPRFWRASAKRGPCLNQVWSQEGDRRVKKSSRRTGIFSFGGQRSSGETRRAFARQSNSKSETHRNCVSILASVSRLKSHPQRRQRAASIGWVSPCWSRKRRICGPTMFRGLLMFQNRNVSIRKPKKPKVRNSERFCLPKNGVRVRIRQDQDMNSLNRHSLERPFRKAGISNVTIYTHSNNPTTGFAPIRQSGTAIRGLPLNNPRPMDAAAGTGHPKGQTMNMEYSLYRRRGKPQRAMAEIRRMLLQKISGQTEKEGLPAALMKSSSVRRRVNK